jgi:hypothetical protein
VEGKIPEKLKKIFTAESAEIAEKNNEWSKTREVPARPLQIGENVIPMATQNPGS